MGWWILRSLTLHQDPCPGKDQYEYFRGMERAAGIEPATSTLGRSHSTAELRPRFEVRSEKTEAESEVKKALSLFTFDF